MEILKQQDNGNVKIADVTFYFRSQMTARDKAALDMIGEYQNGKWSIDRTAHLTKIIELFVTGWDGVTEDGKPVPYSYEVLMTRLPGVITGTVDLLAELATDIGKTVGLFPTAETELKKNA